jgi:hypothetical protein
MIRIRFRTQKLGVVGKIEAAERFLKPSEGESERMATRRTRHVPVLSRTHGPIRFDFADPAQSPD